MAGRESLEDKLASLRALRDRSLEPEQVTELRERIGDRSNLVVAAAATIAGDNTLADLAGDLEKAFGRFLVGPLKDDKLCRAKLAIVRALDKMEHQETDVFLKAARHVQFEPVWGGSEDSAPPLRAAALVALARAEGIGSLPILVDAMADPAKDVRIASAVALGAVGSEAAGLVLRLKVRLGDKDPDVFSECLGGLLAVNAEENLPIVIEYLDPADPPACEAAAVALGRSRLAVAFDPLRDCLPRCHSSELRQQLLLAIAILRRPGAIDYLIGLVATAEEETTASEAVAALRIYKEDARLRERIAEAVRENGGPKLRVAFERGFE
jgi:HEAT repeat protein